MKKLVMLMGVLVVCCLMLAGCGGRSLEEINADFPVIGQSRSEYEQKFQPRSSWEWDLKGERCVFVYYDTGISVAYAGGKVVAIMANIEIPDKCFAGRTYTTTKRTSTHDTRYYRDLVYRVPAPGADGPRIAYLDKYRDASILLMQGVEK